MIRQATLKQIDSPIKRPQFESDSESDSQDDDITANIVMSDSSSHKSTEFESRFSRSSRRQSDDGEDSPVRRTQSYCGVREETSIPRQQSPFKRQPILTGKQVRMMQAQKIWNRI